MIVAGILALLADVKSPSGLYRPPDVVVLVLDDVSWFETQENPTPHLDRLAANGVRFTRCYSNPLCGPSRMGLLFGINEGRHPGLTCGPHEATYFPEPGVPSVPRILADWRSTFLGKWHLGSDTEGNWEVAPLRHGFDNTWAMSPTNVGSESCGPPGTPTLHYARWIRSDAGMPSYLTTTYHTRAVIDGALQELAQPSSAPRLIWACLQAAHTPYHVPPADFLPPGYNVGFLQRDKYVAMVRSADEALGKILDVVDLRKTIVIVVGDNGTPPPVLPVGWPANNSKGTTYERGIRVPLVIGGAGIVKRGESSALVHVSDLPVTLAELLHLPAPAGLEGMSFAGALARSSPSRPRAHVVSRLVREEIDGFERAVIEERWKLRRVTEGTVSTEELFDLQTDPRERTNLIATPGTEAISDRLRAVLDE